MSNTASKRGSIIKAKYISRIAGVAVLFVSVFIGFPHIVTAQASRSFITTWDTRKEGASASNEISIPVNANATYDYFIDWGDGNSDAHVTGPARHTYATPGVYTVKISGTFPRIQFSNSGDRRKILSVEQWGDIVWTSGEAAFYGATNLVINATDTPNLSQVRNVSYMFQDAKSVDGGLENWDVSNIEVFARMFSGASKFNGDISRWDMRNAFNTEYMFAGASLFNRNVGGWNVEKAGIMRGMFSGAVSFNKSVDSWTLTKAFNVEDIFRNAASYNQSIENWNIGSIQNIKGLLNGTALSTNVYDAMLNAWARTQTAKDVVIDAGNSTFCHGAEARQRLITELRWTITDAGADDVFCGAVELTFASVPTLKENDAINTRVGELRVNSTLGGEFSLSLTCTPQSPDAQYFDLNNRVITTNTVFDYEKPSDENKDNAYEICVKITSSNGKSTQKYVLVTVDDQEDSSSQPTSGGGQTSGNGNGGGQGTTSGSGTTTDGEGQVLGESTSKPSVLAAATLASTGVALGLASIYLGIMLSGTAILGFKKSGQKQIQDFDIEKEFSDLS